jgi:anaerobic selenocysteine-containing dehydrogenase
LRGDKDNPISEGYVCRKGLNIRYHQHHADRLRAVIVSGAKSLRSFPETTAYEKAFNRLDLLVSVEIAMTETAALSDYVLPARPAYESWDGGLRPVKIVIWLKYRLSQSRQNLPPTETYHISYFYKL